MSIIRQDYGEVEQGNRRVFYGEATDDTPIDVGFVPTCIFAYSDNDSNHLLTTYNVNINDKQRRGTFSSSTGAIYLSQSNISTQDNTATCLKSISGTQISFNNYDVNTYGVIKFVALAN